MLYKDLEGCEQCPFSINGDCPDGWASSPYGTPMEPPCTCWDDEDDVEEIYNYCIEARNKYEIQEHKKYLEEQEKKEKNAEKARKAREARSEVWKEQAEIKKLRKIIKANNKILSFTQTFAEAINETNEMFGYSERVEFKEKNHLEIENEKILTRIEELEAIKKEKLKALHKRRKIERE